MRDMDHRVPLASLDRAPRPLRAAPAGTGHVVPPVEVVPQVNAVLRLAEDDGAGHERPRLRVGIVGRVQRTLGDRDIAGLLDEAAETDIGHGVAVHPEALDGGLVGGRFLRVVIVRPHQEGAARDPDQPHPRRRPGRSRSRGRRGAMCSRRAGGGYRHSQLLLLQPIRHRRFRTYILASAGIQAFPDIVVPSTRV
jgi:hypothetical protein